MGFFNKKKVIDEKINWKIKRKCLELILEASKSSYPNEFGGLLRVDEKDKHTIVEIVLLPGTISGNSHAIFKMHMLPIDFSIVGTVHSHPSPVPRPSGADLELFGKHGKVHIIAASPYSSSSWKAYDGSGKEINIEVL